ncbi:hypothetical protein J6590_063398 [Homalodisca vitripennis]|nr:hypothetical protein J6590_063398 [Homalodisca vitripennis]
MKGAKTVGHTKQNAEFPANRVLALLLIEAGLSAYSLQPVLLICSIDGGGKMPSRSGGRSRIGRSQAQIGNAVCTLLPSPSVAPTLQLPHATLPVPVPVVFYCLTS